jgi:transposase
MKPYPIELRERIIAAVDNEIGTISEIAEIFNVKERFIYKLLSQRREEGNIIPRPHGGGAVAKLDEKKKEVLAEIVSENPDATLEELRDALKKRTQIEISISTVWRRLAEARLTLKKNKSSSRSRSGKKSRV